MRHRLGNIAGENQSCAFTFRGKPPVDRKTEQAILQKLLKYVESVSVRLEALEGWAEGAERMEKFKRLPRPECEREKMN